MTFFAVNIAEGAYEDVKAALAALNTELQPIEQAIETAAANVVQTVETGAAAAGESIEASFDADLPVLEGQALGLLSALLTGGEAALLALLPVDAGIDVVTAKTALTKAVQAGAAALNPTAA